MILYDTTKSDMLRLCRRKIPLAIWPRMDRRKIKLETDRSNGCRIKQPSGVRPSPFESLCRRVSTSVIQASSTHLPLDHPKKGRTGTIKVFYMLLLDISKYTAEYIFLTTLENYESQKTMNTMKILRP